MACRSAFRWLLFLLGCAAGGAASGGDEVACNGETPQADAAPACLDRIQVTARRREEPLHLVPLSVAVLEGDDAQGRHFHDLAAGLSGLSFTDNGLAPGHDLAIRGISTSAFFSEVRPLTAYYFGDTPLTYPVTPSGIAMYVPLVEPIDLDRVELLRGPQGTHFGAHAMGGALRILPNAPDPEARYGWFGVDALALHGGGQSGGLRAMLNTPWSTGEGALRAVAYTRGQPGWIDDPSQQRRDVNDQRHLGARVATAWRADERWRFEAGVAAQRREGDAPWIDELDEPEYVQTRAVDERETDAWWLAWTDADRQGDGWRLRWHSARFERAFDLDGDISDFALLLPLTPPMTVQNRNRQHEWTHELRLHSDDANSRWHWLLGLFVQNRVYRGGQEFLAPAAVRAGEAPDLGRGSVTSVRTRSDLEQHAIYGDLSWEPSPAWELSAGARFFRTRDRNHTRAAGVLASSDARFGKDDTGHVPRLSLRRSFGRGRMAYVAVAKGYRPAGSNDPSGFDTPRCDEELAQRGLRFEPDYESDSLWNREVGVRLQSDDRRWQLDAAAFDIDWRRVQTDLEFECVGLIMAVNAGRARSRGAELDLVFRPDDRWRFTVSASHARAEYTQTLPSIGLTAGTRLPGVPRLGWRATATWQMRQGVELRLEHARVGASLVNPLDPLRIGGHRVTHLGLSADHGDWRWDAGVRNAFDARIVTGAHRGFLGAFEAVGMPRHAYLSATRHF